MRVGLEVPAILEGAGLAFVTVDRHQPRPRLAENRSPFAPRGETCAAEAAQIGVVERFQKFFFLQLAGAQAIQQRVAATGDIGIVADIVRQMRVGVAALRPRPEHFRRWRDRRSGARPRLSAPYRSARRMARARPLFPAPPQFVTRPAAFPRRASHRSESRKREWSAAERSPRLPSRCRNAHRRWPPRTPPRTPASSHRQVLRGEQRKSGGICPGSGADAQSAGRAAADGRRAIARFRAKPADRLAGPLESIWRDGGLHRDARKGVLFVHRDSSRLLTLISAATFWHATCQRQKPSSKS